MARQRGKAVKANDRSTSSASGANLGFEATLWVADKLRGHMDAAEYKHVVLGLVFVNYITDRLSNGSQQGFD